MKNDEKRNVGIGCYPCSDCDKRGNVKMCGGKSCKRWRLWFKSRWRAAVALLMEIKKNGAREAEK